MSAKSTAAESGGDCAKWAQPLVQAAYRAGITKNSKCTVLKGHVIELGQCTPATSSDSSAP